MAHPPVGVDEYVDPPATRTELFIEWYSVPTRTVGADRIRPQHIAPLRGACAGSTASRPLGAGTFNRVLPEIRGFGRILSAPTRVRYFCGGRAADGSTASRPLQLTYANRFLSGTLPGGAGNQRIGTEDVASLSGGTAAAGGCYPPLQRLYCSTVCFTESGILPYSYTIILHGILKGF